MPTTLIRCVICFMVSLLCISAQARPDPNQKMDTSILGVSDTGYRFQTIQLDSHDGQRHYQLWGGIPDRKAPHQGFPTFWMLDGNAALGGLSRVTLQQLSKGEAPVLVAVGYQTDLRISREARTLDYTPCLGDGKQTDPRSGLPSGGVDAFLKLLTTDRRATVQGIVPLDEQHQAIWGHSYGGLAALKALSTLPGAFSTYAAASAPINWGGSSISQEHEPLEYAGVARRLLLMRGGDEPGYPGGKPLDDSAHPLPSLAKLLSTSKSMEVKYKRFDGLSHGPVLQASLLYTLSSLYSQQ